MSRAQKRDAVGQGKFFFRKNVFPPGHTSPAMIRVEGQGGNPQGPKERKLRNCFPRVPPPSTFVDAPVEGEYEELTMQEIFDGKVGVGCTPAVLLFPGHHRVPRFPGYSDLLRHTLKRSL